MRRVARLKGPSSRRKIPIGLIDRIELFDRLIDVGGKNMSHPCRMVASPTLIDRIGTTKNKTGITSIGRRQLCCMAAVIDTAKWHSRECKPSTKAREVSVAKDQAFTGMQCARESHLPVMTGAVFQFSKGNNVPTW